jgi:replicative DNA helicase
MKRVTTDPDRLAPHSIESEVALIGSVLIDPCVMESLCMIEPDDFFIIKNGWVWSALQRLYKSK